MPPSNPGAMTITVDTSANWQGIRRGSHVDLEPLKHCENPPELPTCYQQAAASICKWLCAVTRLMTGTVRECRTVASQYNTVVRLEYLF